jgi:endonuclease/exonuclease/phosphatase family metal-dependent hydrolase
VFDGQSRSDLRIVTWNCCGGSLAAQLALLDRFSPDLAFVQECHPAPMLASEGSVIQRTVTDRKGLALVSPSKRYRLSPPEAESPSRSSCLAARVEGVRPLHVVGIWAQDSRDYAGDVLQSLERYRKVIEAGPVVVLGDFNSGVALTTPPQMTRRHDALTSRMESLGLVSAYHRAYGVPHGSEQHATYYHQRHQSEPWHIDFCFVPRRWADGLTSVEVGTFDDWSAHSDHRPILVSLRI